MLTVTTEAMFQITALFAAIIWMSVFGLILYGLILFVERLISPWYKRVGSAKEDVIAEVTE